MILNRAKSIDINANSQILQHKNSDQPAIKEVEKIIFMSKFVSKNDIFTQTEDTDPVLLD